MGLRAKGHKWLPWAFYGLLSIAVLWNLLLPGYVLTLDMVFGPNMNYTNQFFGLDTWEMTSRVPFNTLIQVSCYIVSPWIIQKLILFLILFASGLGAHRLFPMRGIGAYFAGILYMINPFTYVRFLAGQWGVMAAYAVTPFAIKAFLDLLDKGGAKNVIKVALLSTLVGMFQIHGLVLLFLAFFIILAVKITTDRKVRARVVWVGKLVGIAALFFLALNLYWLIPALSADDTLVDQISQRDLLFFAPEPTSGVGTMFDLAAMYGFWRGGYTYVKDLLPVWWIGFAFILYLAVTGFLYKLKDGRIGWIVVSFGLMWLVGLVLAAGASVEFTKPAFEWLFEHTVIFRGFRDSQKFVGLLCLCYAFLGGLGVSKFAQLAKGYELNWTKLYRTGAVSLTALALIVPFVYSYTMFGFYGQLKPTDYPQSWYEANVYLTQDEEDYNVLFLPWHMYMDYRWLPNQDKRLANPAHYFFDKPVLCGDNIEAGGIYTQSTNEISSYVEFVLSRADGMGNLGELLAPLNVRYVVLVHEADYKSYEFLYAQQDLAVGFEGENLTVFRNEHVTTRAYGVDSVIHVANLEEYLDLSLQQDVMDHLYVLGEQESDIVGGGMQALGVNRVVPIKYEVDGSAKGWTVFTVPQRVSTENWQGVDSHGVKNLGFMPAFAFGEEGGQIVYTRFYNWYLPSYVISMLTLVVLLAAYIVVTIRRPGS